MAVSVAGALAVALVLLPGIARAERAKSPADATVFVRLVGSLHAEIGEGPFKRTAERDHVELGTGSGFVISPLGYVLTNDHVVNQRERLLVTRSGERARVTVTVSRIEVCFPSGASAAAGFSVPCSEASVTASDSTLDLAVLFVGGTNLPYIALGDSDAVNAGLPVEALGYPFGRDVEVGRVAATPDLVPEISTTPGAISALREGDAGERRYLQISNTVNPGNSGGPLVDRGGFALGVIRMRLTKAAGIGFAIPVNDVKDFLDARGLSHLMPARRLRLGPFERIEPKAMALRLIEGAADTSPFRSRVESEPRSEAVVLRIDRVLSPWTLKQIEQTLVTTEALERGAMSAEPADAPARSADPSLLVGRAGGTAGDATEIAMEYAVRDLGAEKLVARYVGPAEQIAFNRSVLRESLTSLDAQRMLVADLVSAVNLAWVRTPGASRRSPWPLPAGWVVEPGAPSACAGLPQPADVTSASAASDFTLALRAASWASGDMNPDATASACSTTPGSLGAASYAMRTEWLGVRYLIEGVFVRVRAQQVVQLEVLAPEHKSAVARALLAAWAKHATE